MKASIIINSNSSQGKSVSKWELIKSNIIDLLPFETIINYTSSKREAKELIRHLLLKEECDVFIGGGGDGTINFILKQLIEITAGNLKNLMLGGIGLGSSNDFHKPFGRKIKKIPLRLDFINAAFHDIGQVDYSSESGLIKRNYFLLNSNLGLTANANQFFNAPNKTLAFLKKKSTFLSILYASIYTLLKYSNINISEQTGLNLELNTLNNLSIVKSSFLSGSFCYPELVKPDDGKFGIYYINNMSKFQVLKTMFDLTKCKFSNSNKKGKITSEKIELLTNTFVNIETDGEVYRGKDPQYSISSSQINIANPGY